MHMLTQLEATSALNNLTVLVCISLTRSNSRSVCHCILLTPNDKIQSLHHIFHVSFTVLLILHQ